LLEHYDGEVLRLTLLSAHYKQPLDWSENTINQSKTMLDRFYRVLKDLEGVKEAKTTSDEVFDALLDDLNTPKAIAALNALAKTAGEKKTPEAKAALLAAGRQLGVLNKNPDQWLGFGSSNDNDAVEIDALVAERVEAKKAKNFARADEIRNSLSARGIVIEDSAAGSKWRRT